MVVTFTKLVGQKLVLEAICKKRKSFLKYGLQHFSFVAGIDNFYIWLQVFPIIKRLQKPAKEARLDFKLRILSDMKGLTFKVENIKETTIKHGVKERTDLSTNEIQKVLVWCLF